jgi:hypothetical protein
MSWVGKLRLKNYSRLLENATAKSIFSLRNLPSINVDFVGESSLRLRKLMVSENNKVVLMNNHEILNELSPTGDNLICGGGIDKTLLQYPNLNYVKINKGAKRCIELRWNTRVYRHDCFSLNEHLRAGGMYGVQTNNSFIEIDGVQRNLIIIDFDSREFQDKVLDKFPETLATTSGSPKNCVHLWLATDKQEKKFAIKDEEENTLADVFGEHGQVVAPGSVHPSGSTYRIVKDVPIAYMPYDEILNIIKPYMKEEPKQIIKPKQSYGTNSFYDMVKSRIDVIDVLGLLGIDTNRPRTNCPLHESVSGECLSFNREVWNCHHCGKNGNVFSLVKEAYNLGTKETFEKLAELTNLEDELKEEQVNFRKQEGRK